MLTVLVALLLLNSILSVFVEHYYPTYGKYRLFAIVTDSMEPEIPAGNMIVGRVPESESDIEVGTVITFEAKYNGTTLLLTHRVIAVGRGADGEAVYTTKGDNADGVDAYNPKYSDVVGVFTGNQCGFFGYFFGFMQSPEGAIALIIIALIIVITAIVLHYVWVVNIWRTAALNALTRSGLMLKGYNEEEAGTIADVLGIVTKEPNDKRDLMRKDKKLRWFAETGMLPQRPYADDLDEALAMLEMQRKRRANMPAEESGLDFSDLYTWEEISRRAGIIAKRALEIKRRADALCLMCDKSRWEEISRRAGQLTDRAVEILFKAERLCCRYEASEDKSAAETELEQILGRIQEIAARTTEIKDDADEKIRQAEELESETEVKQEEQPSEKQTVEEVQSEEAEAQAEPVEEAQSEEVEAQTEPVEEIQPEEGVTEEAIPEETEQPENEENSD